MCRVSSRPRRVVVRYGGGMGGRGGRLPSAERRAPTAESAPCRLRCRAPPRERGASPRRYALARQRTGLCTRSVFCLALKITLTWVIISIWEHLIRLHGSFICVLASWQLGGIRRMPSRAVYVYSLCWPLYRRLRRATGGCVF